MKSFVVLNYLIKGGIIIRKSEGNRIKPIVFFPAFILLVISVVLSFVNYESFLKVTTIAKNFMTIQCGWMFSLAGVACLVVVTLAYFSPLANVKIGGPDAKPLLKKSSWFSITLCTTIAAGILFWGTAEPIWHIAYPPKGIEPMSPASAKFAMETLFLHWTFIPYAFYAVPTIVFAFAYYNMNRSFSVGSEMSPIIPKHHQHKFNTMVDAIILFAVAAAISASFGTSVMNMGGGINALFGIDNNKALWIVITLIGTTAFIISSGTGLFKGIKILSDLNVYLYYIIIAAIVFLGPTVYMFSLGTESFGGFLSGFFDKALFTGAAANDTWATGWTTFYWSNWMAWAPVTAVFLARISYGYTVKEVITMNFIIPSAFSAIWMTVLGGTSINLQMSGKVDILAIMNDQGSAAAGYAVLGSLPFSELLIGIYLIAVIISFTTATDSTTNAMASICTSGITEGAQEAPLYIKVTWGVIVGAVALIFIATLGIDGIKMLSYLGGFPALFLGVLSIISLIHIMGKPEKFNVHGQIDKECNHNN
ncbi:BCCT family transporter [Anaeromicrobium sediminis]|uniref:BCCT transporter n=1 Tax=Anaeromicrobium sediminis TaxID=1478221 RepID=A0A267ML04_9FIRM|nr:BCCT family transporter [Anaeromicrobium sediminis]PAB60092.1 BCCT transporter [Anaeromicrobium sediminis]